MNDKLQNASAEAINQMMAWLKQGGEYVAGQAPELAKQLIAYSLTASTIGAVCGFVILIAGVSVSFLGIRKFIPECKKDILRQDEGTLLGSVLLSFVGIVMTMFGIGQTVHSVNTILLITIAPKIFLLQKFADMVK